MKMTQIKIDELMSLAMDALMAKGATEEEATIICEDYLTAELDGRESHGFRSFQVALGAFPKRGSHQIVRDLGHLIYVEGNGDEGHTVSRKILNIGLERIKKHGVVVIGIGNVTRVNSPGVIARRAADAGALVMATVYGGKSFVTSPGGNDPILSTNPLGLAIPGTSPLFVHDFAVSEKALGYISMAKEDGKEIPDRWAVNKAGQPTTNPEDAHALLPFGRYKGFGLALFLEVLGGTLMGVEVGASGDLANRGVFLLLVDPESFGNGAEWFNSRVNSFLESVVHSGTRYPGVSASDRSSTSEQRGSVNLPTSVIENLKSAAQVQMQH